MSHPDPTPTPTLPLAGGGGGPRLGGGPHLASNVVHFARVLRRAGLPVGSDRIQGALQALQVAGLERKRDFRETLAATLIGRIEHRALFDQAFELFWRDPDIAGRMMAAMLPQVKAQPNPNSGPPKTPDNQRLAEGLFPKNKQPPDTKDAPPPDELPVDAALTWSDRERLSKTDFESMSTDEWNAARRLVGDLRLAFPPRLTRRFGPAQHAGRADWRATMQRMAREGGEFHGFAWREPREKPPPLVVLADISGSMSRYSRMLLHFAHAVAQSQVHGGTRVESFVFGTRLTRITRLLKSRDPDLAIGQVVQAVDDWAGGTRISECLHRFNRQWARRVLPGNSTVLLVTDGLEHGDTTALGFETARLASGCKELIWLNPLLRFDRFEPRAAGIRAMLPHVSRFVPAHNLASLEALVRALAGAPEDLRDRRAKIPTR